MTDAEVLVVGAGSTGLAVAAAAVAAGVSVELVDHDSAALREAEEVLAAPAGSTHGALRLRAALPERASSVRVVVDATPDDISAKRLVLRDLDQLTPAPVPVVSATACHPAWNLSAACRHPERVLGMSRLSASAPARLLELAPSSSTAVRTTRLTAAVFEELGLSTVVCQTDAPGLISVRLGLAMLVESARLVEEGVCTPEEVDLVAKGMYRHSTGPFEALSEIGLEVAAARARALAAHYGDDRFTAAPLLSLRSASSGARAGRG